jgi:MFS transporter, FHS family, glucose/mannose:H+ symporter
MGSVEVPAAVNRWLSSRMVLVLYVEFALTGTATTLLGPLLPSLVKRCTMSDADAGLLVAAQFTGQFFGALLANRSLRNSLVFGMPLVAAGVAMLAFSSCRLSYVCVACYGVGLGLTISAINLIIARRDTQRRAYALTLLNFLWGIGAVSSPILVEWSRRHQLLPAALVGLGVIGLGMWLAVIRGDFSSPPKGETAGDTSWYSPPLVLFGVLFFLYVGVETAVGAWTALYATRTPRVDESVASFAVGCFWLALLSGRLINAALLRRVRERRIYLVSLAIALGGLSLFLAARSSLEVLFAASVTGLGLAPLFPLILSFASDFLLACRNSGWVFSSAGLGGAAVPWLTGQVSAQFGSLRAGFVVPASAAVVISVLSLARLGKPPRPA